MKKHFKAYTTGFKGAKELRIALMDTKNVAEVKKVAKEFLGGKLLHLISNPRR